MRVRTSGAGLLWALSLTMIISACAGISPERMSEEEAAVMARAKAYWDLRAKRKFAEIYEYETPAYRRKVDLQNYIIKYAAAATSSAEVKEVSIKGDIARVLVVTTAAFPMMGSRSSPRDDYWQRIDGEWYHLREEVPLKKKPPAPWRESWGLREKKAL